MQENLNISRYRSPFADRQNKHLRLFHIDPIIQEIKQPSSRILGELAQSYKIKKQATCLGILGMIDRQPHFHMDTILAFFSLSSLGELSVCGGGSTSK
jgi:hypothetical protein